MTNELKLIYNKFNFSKRLPVGARSLFLFYDIVIKFVCFLKIGGDRYRRNMRYVELHAEDDSSLLNHLSYL